MHGLAELTLAMEGNTLEVAFTSPAESIVGFEYAAVSEAEKQAVAKAAQTLRQPDLLFTFEGTGCRVQSVEVDLSGVTSSVDGEPAERDNHDGYEAHDEHKDHNDHNGHDHDHDHEHGEGTAHSDISAQYVLACESGDKLQSIRVNGEALPFGIEKIAVMWVTDRGQGGSELRAGQQVITFD